MCRGNRRETIFEDEKDCVLFMETLAEVCARTGWQVFAYVLMPNHYHMVIETPEANLVTGMKWFQGTYTKRHNYRHREWGHLFQGRYKSVIIDPGDSGYFRAACDYVHLNPVRALLAGTHETDALANYRWSSSWYLSRTLSQTPSWLALGCVVEESMQQADSPKSRRLYLESLEKRGKVEDCSYRSLRRGWCLGSAEFKEELRDGLCESLGRIERGSVVGEPRRMHDETEAERLLMCAANIVGLDLTGMDLLKKGDVRKGLVAWCLSQSTSVGQKWIAKRLGMGDPSNVSRVVHRVGRTKDPEVVRWKKELAEDS
jgi:putative transposase